MAYENHYIGAEEHVICDRMTDYHRYIPYDCIKYDLLPEEVQDRMINYYSFCKGFAQPGFLPESVLKTKCGIWITSDDNTFAQDKSFHCYYSFDYGNLTLARLNEFYDTIDRVEPDKMRELRLKEIDFGLEGVSLNLSGEIVKYVTLFRPQSEILDYFDFAEIDKVKEFVRLNFEEWEMDKLDAPSSMKSPIRIQFDAVDDTTSIELVSPFFLSEYYASSGSTQSYLDRKELFFSRLAQAELFTEEEIDYCKQNSPAHQQFSVKLKWKNNQLVNKKLYTFAVVDFERIL